MARGQRDEKEATKETEKAQLERWEEKGKKIQMTYLEICIKAFKKLIPFN